MICYASRTGTRRNLEALRRHGWRLIVSRAGEWRTEGFTRIAAENGAFADYQAGREFDEDAFEEFLDWLPITPDWIVLPDIVAGGHRSLALSMRYLNRCAALAPLVLLAVQDGIEPPDVAPLVGTGVGIFLGGSTEWKLERMWQWGEFCAQPGNYEYVGADGRRHTKLCHYHAARINTNKRMYQAIWCGANSIDGSSGSRYAVTVPKLSYASHHRDLFSPRESSV